MLHGFDCGVCGFVFVCFAFSFSVYYFVQSEFAFVFVIELFFRLFFYFFLFLLFFALTVVLEFFINHTRALPCTAGGDGIGHARDLTLIITPFLFGEANVRGTGGRGSHIMFVLVRIPKHVTLTVVAAPLPVILVYGGGECE